MLLFPKSLKFCIVLSNSSSADVLSSFYFSRKCLPTIASSYGFFPFISRCEKNVVKKRQAETERVVRELEFEWWKVQSFRKCLPMGWNFKCPTSLKIADYNQNLKLFLHSQPNFDGFPEMLAVFDRLIHLSNSITLPFIILKV